MRPRGSRRGTSAPARLGIGAAVRKDHLGYCIESAIVSEDQAEQREKASALIGLLERAAR